MYARCPECLSSQQVSSKRLKKKQGMIICANCAHKFNALSSLKDTPHIDKAKPENNKTPYPWQKQRASHPIPWLIGSVFGLILLALQIHYFIGYPLAQMAQIRPWLQTLHHVTRYPLAAYRNLTEFTTIGSSLQQSPNNDYRLQVSFINHAEFSQALPQLQLTLHNLQGGIFAQRVFSPQEYLTTTKQGNLTIKPSSTLDIDLLLAPPSQTIAGYEITLI
ncbi:MAG: hypothetical protein methR_P0163 [Methyloprofundus sp.]|nr:MAG: hypothetical protein methR_P0163 [Methyloprofundus sp.]